MLHPLHLLQHLQHLVRPRGGVRCTHQVKLMLGVTTLGREEEEEEEEKEEESHKQVAEERGACKSNQTKRKTLLVNQLAIQTILVSEPLGREAVSEL